jgi:hypothetical protein
MAIAFPAGAAGNTISRPMVKGLFVASCLLSIVSWYTTEQGMALYLSVAFSVLASLGIQASLVLVAWLIGFTKARRTLLITVYAITAVVSIAFSYVSLYTWFAARERPAAVERRLYDTLNEAGAKTETILAEAAAEQQKHITALQEMTGAEKSHGYISRAQDVDPYLQEVRQAVAKEAQSYASSYKEGSGEGLRYTAFDRYTKLATESLGRIQAAEKTLSRFRAELKPLDPTEAQLRSFHAADDSLPWNDVEQALHKGDFVRPAAPRYSEFVDRSVSSQEDLLIAFQELFTAPTGRHIFALLLAAFIDIIVFLLAYASGPYFFGSPEQRWVAAGAALEGIDTQVFTRDFLRKFAPNAQGLARVDAAALTPGEQQLCLLMTAKGLAATVEENGELAYLLDQEMHEQLLESLATRTLTLRASARRATAEAGSPTS